MKTSPPHFTALLCFREQIYWVLKGCSIFGNMSTHVRGEIKAFKMGVLRFNSFGEITVQSRNHLSILGALFINTLGEISIAIRMK